MIERVYRSVEAVSERAVIVGGGPVLGHLGVLTIPDRHPGANAMGGIATALEHAMETLGEDALVLCVACDMPLLAPTLLLALYQASRGYDAVVPRTKVGYEPLCAVYRVSCIPAFQGEIARGNLRIPDAYRKLRLRELDEEALRRVDPGLRSFVNINWPEDLVAILHSRPADP